MSSIRKNNSIVKINNLSNFRQFIFNNISNSEIFLFINIDELTLEESELKLIFKTFKELNMLDHLIFISTESSKESFSLYDELYSKLCHHGWHLRLCNNQNNITNVVSNFLFKNKSFVNSINQFIVYFDVNKKNCTNVHKMLNITFSSYKRLSCYYENKSFLMKLVSIFPFILSREEHETILELR